MIYTEFKEELEVPQCRAWAHLKRKGEPSGGEDPDEDYEILGEHP